MEKAEISLQLKNTLSDINSKIISEEDRRKILSDITRFICDLCKANENVYSVFTAGSLTRGDFIPYVSDFDLIVVFKKENDESEFLRNLEKKAEKELERYFGDTSHANWSYDIRSEFLFRIPTVSNPNPKNKTDIGYFLFRSFDTVKNGKVLYGAEFLGNLIVIDPKETAVNRVKALLMKYYQKDDDMWRIMHIGDIIKAVQIYFGKATYDKREVLKGFIGLVPDFEKKDFVFIFWKEYLDNHFFEKNDRRFFIRESELFLSQLLKTMDFKDIKQK